MTSNTRLETVNLRKHRSFSGAMLSGWGKFLIFLGFLGIIFIIIFFVGRITTSIPGSQSSNQGLGSPPQRVKISTINVDASVVSLNLNLDGTLEVPKKSEVVGWYVGSPAPGSLGPAVLVGHLDSFNGPAVFQNLHKLKPGDAIEITRQDGSAVTFKVTNSQKYSQDDFPTNEVYGSLDYAGLRLITCAGKYSKITGRYQENLVVYATMVK
jgi:hypothetical protein